MKERLDTAAEFHATVKIVCQAEDSGADGYVLKDLFRDSEQDKNMRQRGLTEPLDRNYVYDSFKLATLDNSRQVHVADVSSLEPIHEGFKERARRRGYRTVLAFPLNLPRFTSTVNTLPLIGFLGFDSPQPNVFRDFFSRGNKEETQNLTEGPVETLQNSENSDGRLPREELNLFYGLADACATILILSGLVSLPKDPDVTKRLEYVEAKN